MNLEALPQLKACSLLSSLAEECIFKRPQDECFIPIANLIPIGWKKYAHEHPEEKDIYKNGVYMNDESQQIGEALVYATLNVGISHLLVGTPQMINEFRMDLCMNFYDYLENLYKRTGNMPCVYNKNTLNWDNFYRITHDSKRFGETLSFTIL